MLLTWQNSKHLLHQRRSPKHSSWKRPLCPGPRSLNVDSSRLTDEFFYFLYAMFLKKHLSVSTHFGGFPSSPDPSVFSWGLFVEITTSRLAAVLIEVNRVDSQKWDWNVFLLWSLETQMKGVYNSLKTSALDSWSYKILPVPYQTPCWESAAPCLGVNETHNKTNTRTWVDKEQGCLEAVSPLASQMLVGKWLHEICMICGRVSLLILSLGFSGQRDTRRVGGLSWGKLWVHSLAS